VSANRVKTNFGVRAVHWTRAVGFPVRRSTRGETQVQRRNSL